MKNFIFSCHQSQKDMVDKNEGVKEEEMEAEAMQTNRTSGRFPGSLSRAWLKGRLYDKKIDKLNAAIATFHFITASFETIPEVWILLTFLATNGKGDIVVVGDNDILFYGITIFTILTIANSESIQPRFGMHVCDELKVSILSYTRDIFLDHNVRNKS